jgi:hypothetical protein
VAFAETRIFSTSSEVGRFGLIAQPRWAMSLYIQLIQPRIIILKKFPYLVAREFFSSDDMGAVQFFASFIRLTQYSGVWMYCYFAVKYYHAVRKLPELRGAPYEDTIYPSHMLNFALVFIPFAFLPICPFALLIADTDCSVGNLERYISSGRFLPTACSRRS